MEAAQPDQQREQDDASQQTRRTAATRRALRQQLTSLYQAGVRELPRPTVDTVAVAPSAVAAAPTPRATPVPSETPGPSGTPGARQTVPPPETMPPELQRSAAAAVQTGKPPAVSPPEARHEALRTLAREVATCSKCRELCAGRTQTVFGIGDPHAQLCFLGEAPGADEDRVGEPFVGRAGQLLTKIIEAMSLRREEVYILNILKCRPPGNRNPLPEEAHNCRPFLDRQLSIIQPAFICCLGSVAASNLLATKLPIGRLRGRLHDWQGIRVLATYHPAYLLRNPAAKADVWQDVQLLMQEMGLQRPH